MSMLGLIGSGMGLKDEDTSDNLAHQTERVCLLANARPVRLAADGGHNGTESELILYFRDRQLKIADSRIAVCIYQVLTRKHRDSQEEEYR